MGRRSGLCRTRRRMNDLLKVKEDGKELLNGARCL